MKFGDAHRMARAVNQKKQLSKSKLRLTMFLVRITRTVKAKVSYVIKN